MKTLTKHLQPVFDDHESGSGEILHKLMDAVYYMTEDEEISITREFPEKLVKTCLQKLGNFAIVIHFLDAMLKQTGEEFGTEELIQFLKNYQEEWQRKHGELTKHLKSVQPVKGQTILVHSNSSSITNILGNIATDDGTSGTTIFQSISHPKREGIIQGRVLMKHGWNVIFIEDATMGKMLTQCDLVLLGSDVISASTFVNKVGSMSLVAAAKLLKIPVYVIGDDRKLVDENTLPDWLDAKLMNESPREVEELELENGEKGLNYYFEHTPTPWVNGIVLQNGIFTPEQIKDMAGKYSYSEELLAMAQKLK